jgi:hypothetical protein
MYRQILYSIEVHKRVLYKDWIPMSKLSATSSTTDVGSCNPYCNVLQCVLASYVCKDEDSILDFFRKVLDWYKLGQNHDVPLYNALFAYEMTAEPHADYESALSAIFMKCLYNAAPSDNLVKLVTDMILVYTNTALCICDQNGDIGSQCVVEPDFRGNHERLPPPQSLLLMQRPDGVCYDLMHPTGKHSHVRNFNICAEHTRIPVTNKPYIVFPK